MAWLTEEGNYWWAVEKVKDWLKNEDGTPKMDANGQPAFKWKNRVWSTGFKNDGKNGLGTLAAGKYINDYNEDKARVKRGYTPIHKIEAQKSQWWDILKRKMNEHIDTLGAHAQKKARFLIGVFEDLFTPAGLTLEEFEKKGIGAAYIKKRLAGEPATRWCGTEKLVHRPIMASTLKTEISYLSTLFELAVDEWRDEVGLTRNPFKRVKVAIGPGVVAEKEDPKYLSPEMVGSFLSECGRRHGDNFQLMAEMFYYAGTRLDECRPIRVADVDVRAGGVMLRGTKTAKSKGFVQLPDHFMKKLEAAIKTALPGYLFPHGEAGKMIPYSTVQQRFKRCFRAIGAPWAHAHTLRHCYVSHRLENGDNPVAVRDGARHKNLATTSKYTRRGAQSQPVTLPAPLAQQPAA